MTDVHFQHRTISHVVVHVSQKSKKNNNLIYLVKSGGKGQCLWGEQLIESVLGMVCGPVWGLVSKADPDGIGTGC